MTLEEIATTLGKADQVSKGPELFRRYEGYFAPLVGRSIRMLELGVHVGDSLKVFSTYFRNGVVVGVDISAPHTDFSSFKNAIFELADQREAKQLEILSARHAPEGWDIILDDASHYGSWSKLSFDALFPLLKPGGLYVIEDWQTGYWDDWPDGKRYQQLGVDVLEGHIPPRVPSHDLGMVGFVKSMVDELATRPVGGRSSVVGYDRKFEWMHINAAFAILQKLAA